MLQHLFALVDKLITIQLVVAAMQLFAVSNAATCFNGNTVQ